MYLLLKANSVRECPFITHSSGYIRNLLIQFTSYNMIKKVPNVPKIDLKESYY